MPLRIEYSNGSTLTFESDLGPSHKPLVVSNATRIKQMWVHCILVRGILATEDPASVNGLDHVSVVVKIVLNSDYVGRTKRERDFYAEFDELQGHKIPKFYGAFRHKTSNMCEPKAAIVLQDLGVPVNDYLWKYSLEFRWDLVNTVIAIHERGYTLDERVTIFDVDGRPVICGFAETSPHQCPCIRPPSAGVGVAYHPYLQPNIYEPLLTDFPCRNLYFYCELAEVWTPKRIDFYGHRCNAADVMANWIVVADLALLHATPEEALSAAQDAALFLARTYVPDALTRIQERIAEFDKANGLERYKSTRRALMSPDGSPREPRMSFPPMDIARPHLAWPRPTTTTSSCL